MTDLKLILTWGVILGTATAFHNYHDHCKSSPCLNGGTCDVQHYYPYFSCRCRTAFSGNTCAVDKCLAHPCLNGAPCYYNSGAAACRCLPGFYGEYCQIDSCYIHPCLNGATCIHLSSDSPYSTCHCSAGFHGDECQFPGDAHGVQTTNKPRVTSTAGSVTTTKTVPPTIVTTTVTERSSTTRTSVAISTPTVSSGNTPIPLETHHCNKLASVNDIAIQVSVSNENASTCSMSGEKKSPDAYVLNHCNVTLPNSWKPGVQVMSACSYLKTYTPISVFQNGVYDPTNVACGIFLGCLANGLRLANQECGHAPKIDHIEIGGVGTKDPYNFYTIQ